MQNGRTYRNVLDLAALSLSRSTPEQRQQTDQDQPDGQQKHACILIESHC